MIFLSSAVVVVLSLFTYLFDLFYLFIYLEIIYLFILLSYVVNFSFPAQYTLFSSVVAVVKIKTASVPILLIHTKETCLN